MYVLKSAVRRTLKQLGYAVVPIPQDGSPAGNASSDYQSTLEGLSHSHTMRTLHAGDPVEIEALYRHFVFPDLPQNKQRAGLLYELIGTSVGEGIYVITNLHRGMKVPGDICEFGVAQGATSRLIANEIMSTDRKLWLFDSFEGLPEPTVEDKLIDDIFNLGSMSRYKGTMASPETEVLSKLASINFPPARTMVKKGWVKDAIKSSDLPAQVAFAYVDFDFYEPIKDALEFLDGRMPVGGRIVVDDYGFFSEGAQLAVDRFVAASGGRYTFELPLPFAGHFCVLSKVG
jgi:O-methyltransferase